MTEPQASSGKWANVAVAVLVGAVLAAFAVATDGWLSVGLAGAGVGFIVEALYLAVRGQALGEHESPPR